MASIVLQEQRFAAHGDLEKSIGLTQKRTLIDQRQQLDEAKAILINPKTPNEDKQNKLYQRLV
jgi:AmiR/NasT family two-component response regulator